MRNILLYHLTFLFFFVATKELSGFNKGVPLTGEERIAKIDQQLSIARSKLRINTQESMKAARKARALSLDFDENKLVSSNLLIAQIYQQKGIIDTALLLANRTLAACKSLKNDTLLAEAYHTLGLNYQFTGSIELAIESYHDALKLNETLGLYEASMRQLNNIGLLYREEKQYDLALKYLEKCLQVSREKGFQKYESYSYGNIGYILMKQNKWDEALERFERTLALSHILMDTFAYCTINYLISDVKLNQGDYPAAKDFANTALAVANKLDYAVGKVFSQRVLSEVCLREKKYDQARKIANENLNYLKGNSVNLYLEDVLTVLYNIEYETGNYKKALTIQKRLSIRKDSLNQLKAKEKIANSEYKYQLLKNEQENQLLKLQNDSSQRNVLLAIMIALLLLLLAFLSFFAYRKSKDNNEILEEAIDKRTKELESSNQHLAKSNLELERFAFIASHDLKTPLRNIVSFTGLLERQLKNHEDEKVHEYLSFIKKGGIRMNNLIIDTLEFSRLASLKKEDETQEVNLNLLLEELQSSMSAYIKERNANILILNELPCVKADASSIVLLFQNLIENSIKYNNSDQPTIKISTKETQSFLSILIEDNGIGIAEEYHEEIFVMFSRLHNQNEYEGSGLGLSICKKIIDKLAGEIRIQSKVDKGSIFEISLPRQLIVAENLSLSANSTI